MWAMAKTLEPPLVDILSQKTRYIYFSLPDTRQLIYDASDCQFVACAPNPDHTLTALKDNEQVILEPIKLK